MIFFSKLRKVEIEINLEMASWFFKIQAFYFEFPKILCTRMYYCAL